VAMAVPPGRHRVNIRAAPSRLIRAEAFMKWPGDDERGGRRQPSDQEGLQGAADGADPVNLALTNPKRSKATSVARTETFKAIASEPRSM